MLSALAKQDSGVGAVTFAGFWLRTIDWGYSTTDSDLLRMYSAASCSECTRFASIFDRAKVKNEHFGGGHLTARKYELVDPAGHLHATRAVDITYAQQAVRLINSHGKVEQRAPSLDREIRRIWLVRVDNGWQVVDTKEVHIR